MEFITKFKNYLLAPRNSEGLSSKDKPSEVTVKNYLADIKQFISWVESAYAAPFQPQNISIQIINEFKKQKMQVLSASSIDRHISSLRKFFTFLKLNGDIANSPFDQASQATDAAKVDPWHIRDFKNYLYIYNASHLTIKNYLIDVKQFLSWAETVLKLENQWNVSERNVLIHITNDLLNEYKNRLLQDGSFSPASINRKLSSLRKYITWAAEQGLLSTQNSDFRIQTPLRNDESEILKAAHAQHATAQDLSTAYFTSDKTHYSDNPINPIQSKKHYSNIPPIRLIQKMANAGTYTFDMLITSPVAFLFRKVEHGKWVVKGKPLFKTISNFQLPVSNSISSTALKNLTTKTFKPQVKNISKDIYAPQLVSTKHFPWYKKIFFHARYTRPTWYHKYHQLAIAHYFNWAVLIIFSAAIGFGMYNSFFQKPNPSLAALPTAGTRILSFQGRLTDANDNPISTATWIRFVVYNDVSASGSARLWEEVDKVSPDQDGIFSLNLGSDGAGGQAALCNSGNPPTSPATGACGIPQSLFAQNSALWLGVTVENKSELTPREQIATVAYAVNAETLQGLPPITQTGAGTSNVVLALNSSGNLSIGASTQFQATSGSFTLEGDSVNLITNATSNSNIVLNPSNLGQIDLQKPVQNSTLNNNIPSAAGAVEVDDLMAILATSSGQSALTIAQNGTGPIISASHSGTAEFTVDNSGNGIFNGNVTGQTIYTGGGTTYYINNATSHLNSLTLAADIAVSGNVNSNLTPSVANTDTYTLGTSASQEWLAVYAKNIYSNGQLISNLWQENTGVLSSIHTQDDLAIGGTSTSSARFQIFGTTGNATTTGSLTFNGNAQIQSANNQTLTFGGSSTGNIVITPQNGSGLLTLNGNFIQTGATAFTTGTGLTTVGGNLTVNGNTQTVGNGGNFTIQTTSNGNLNLLSAGTGNIALGQNAGLGNIVIQPNAGGQAALTVIKQVSTGDIITASSSAATEFRVTNGGNVIARTFTDLDNTNYFLDPAGVTNSLIIAGTEGIGTTNPLLSSGLDIEKDALGNATEVVNQSNTVGPIFTASSSGQTRFTIANDGTLTATKYNTDKGILYLNGTTGTIAETAQGGSNTVLHGNGSSAPSFSAVDLNNDTTGTLAINKGGTNGTATPTNGQVAYGNGTAYAFTTGGSTGNCLTFNSGSAPTWVTCATGSAGTNYWTLNQGSLYPINSTVDFLVGGTSTASAKFAVVNDTGSGTPTASVSGNLSFSPAVGTNPVINLLNGNSLTFKSSVGGDAGLGSAILTLAPNGNLTTTGVTTTFSGTNPALTASGSNTFTLNSGSTGNIQFFNSNSTIDQNGNLTINGTATIKGSSISVASGITIDTIGSSGTINLGTGANTSALILGKSGSSIRDANLTTDGVVFVSGGNGTLNSEAQLATSRGGLGANVTAAGAGELLYSTSTTAYGHLAAGNSGQCLLSNGSSAPSWSSCSIAANSYWTLNAGTLYPINTTLDFFVGGTSTSSAKFAVVNDTGSGTPTASVSGNLSFSPAVGTNPVINLLNGNSLTFKSSVGGDAGLGSAILTLAPNGNLTTTGVTTTFSGTNPSLTTSSNNNLSLLAGTGTITLGTSGTGGNIQFFSGSNTLTNAGALTIASTLTVNGATETGGNGSNFTLQTTTNGNLNLLSAGTGNIALGQNAGLGNIVIQPNAGGQAALFVNKQNNVGDILTASSSSTTKFILTNSGTVGIGSGITDASLLANTGLDVEKDSLGNATVLIHNTGASNVADLFTASNSAGTKFTIQNDGTLITPKYNTADGLLYLSNTTGTVAETAQGASHTVLHGNGSSAPTFSAVDLTADVGSSVLPINNGGTNGTATPTNGQVAYGNGTAYAFTTGGSPGNCLTFNTGSAPTWASCAAGSATNYWTLNAGTLYPINTTVDFFVGGTSTASAKFAVVNDTGSGTPTASAAGNLTFSHAGGTNPVINLLNGNSLTFKSSVGGDAGLGSAILTLAPNGNLTTTGVTTTFSGTNPALTASGSNTFTLNSGSTGNIQFFSGSNTLTNAGALTIASTLTVNGTSITVGNGSTSTIGTTNAALNLNSGSGVLTLNSGGAGNIDFFSTSNVLTNAGNLTLAGTLTLSANSGNTLTSVTNFAEFSNGISFGNATTFNIDKNGNATLNSLNLPVAGGTGGYWTLSSSVLSPTNKWNDLAIGGTATSSALFQVFANSGTATTSGNIVFTGTAPRVNILNGGGLGFYASVGGNAGLPSNPALLIAANNNVGIGTTTPLTALQISGSASVSANLSLYGASTNHTINMLQGGTLGFYTSTGGDTGLASAGFPTLYLTNNNVNGSGVGSVGIGTNNPLALAGLDIEKNGLGNSILDVNQLGLGDVLTASVSGTTKFVINNNGNVGIGPSVTTAQGIVDVASAGPNFPSDLTLGQIAATNWVANPSFEASSPLNNWSFTNSSAQFSASSTATESAVFGDRSLKFYNVAPAATYAATSSCMPVLPNNNYTASAFVYVVSGFGGNAGIDVQTFTTNNCSGAASTTGRVNQTTTNTWKRISTTVSTAGGISSLQVRFISDGTNTNSRAYADGFQVELGASATPYLDGSLGPGYYWDNTGSPNATDSSRLSGSTFAYQTLNSASGIGAASRGTFPTLQLDQNGTGDLIGASASGVTQFQVTSGGNIFARKFTDLDNTSYFLDPAASPSNTALDIAGSAVIGASSNIASGVPLYVVQTQSNSGSEYTDANTGIYINNTTAGGYATLKLFGAASGGFSSQAIVFGGTSNGDVLRIEPRQTPTAGLSIMGSGNVGIETSSPNSFLDIEGTYTSNAGASSAVQFSSTTNNTTGINEGFGLFPKETSAAGNTFQAMRLGATANGSFTEPNLWGITITAPTLSGGAAVTTVRGLNIEPQKATGVTTAYGLYQGGTNDLNYFAGNVGIGINAPSQLFETYNSSGGILANFNTSTQEVLFDIAAGSGAFNGITQSGDNALIYGGQTIGTANGFVIAPWSSSTSGLRMDSSGNVGIGTTSPNAPLEITHDTGSGTEAPLIQLNSVSGGTGNAGSIYWINNSDTGPLAKIYGADSGGWGGNLIFGTKTNTGGSGGSVSEKMRISNDGGLMLGQTSTDPGSGSMYAASNIVANGCLAAGNGYNCDGNTFEANGTSSFTGGNVGIGTTSPTHPLQIEKDISPVKGLTAGQEANAQFVISGSSNTNKQLRFGVDTSAGTMFAIIQSTVFGSTSNTLMLNPDGGSVQGGNACTVNIGGPFCHDYAETYNASEIVAPADLVSLDSSSASGKLVNKSRVAYDQNILGVGSTTPAVIINDGSIDLADHSVVTPSMKPPVALAGRVPLKVSTINGSIFVGDAITSSTLAGIGMKATQEGPSVGKAMEAFDPAHGENGIGIIPCPDGTPSTVICGSIEVFINVSWYDPNVYLTTTGDMNFTQASPSADFTIPHYYTLSDALGNPISQMGAFLELAVGNLRAGSVQAQQTITNTLTVTTDNVSIAGQSLHDYIASVVSDVLSQTNQSGTGTIAQSNSVKTNIISPLDNSNIAIRLNNSRIEIAKDASSSAVASIDNNGNATFSGTLHSQNLAINGDATVSGTLHANNIEANTISGLAAVVSTLSAQNVTNVTNLYFATPSATPTNDNSITGSGNTGSSSGQLLSGNNFTDIASFSAYFAYVPNLKATTGLFTDGLTSLGPTSLTDTTIDGQLSIGSQLILADTSVNVLGADFAIQSLRQGGVNFEGGLVAIDTSGNLSVNGNAMVKGTLAVGTLSPLAGGNVNVILNNSGGSQSTSSAAPNFNIQNASGSAVFAINQLGDVVASGEATINKLNFNLVQPALAISDTEVAATGSAGTTFIKAHQTEVTIDDPQVTNQSLIYITPVGTNQTPYLERQVSGTSFTVGIPTPQLQNVNFNWLIVN